LPAPVTIKDIARRAHVSHSTVSRALRDHDAIPADTADRIKRLALRMGYVPSAAARSLKTSRSHAVGVVVTNIADPFLSQVVGGVEDVLLQAGYSLFLAASHRENDRAHSVLRALAEHRIDGALICSSQVNQAELAALESFGVPLVLINNDVPGDFAHSISHDDEWGGRLVTRHLIELGHQRIAYLGNAGSAQTNHDRQAGYLAEMAAQGLPALPAWRLAAPNGRPEGGRLGADAFLALAPRPTALFCFNDMVALGALQRLKAAGCRVPRDVSLAGFDDVFVAEYADPPLTTFVQPKRQLGAEAAALLLSLLSGTEPPRPRARTIRGELRVRASTTPPKV
jgi:DNA-binding LacI/PurR family transcriptional regulator